MILQLINGLLKISQAEELPDKLTFNNRGFILANFYLGDVDYLRNEREQLIGFAYIVGTGVQELIFCQRLAQTSKNVEFKDNLLLLFLKETEAYKIECVQAIGTRIYQDNTENFIFIIPDWGFGEILNEPVAADE